MCISLFLFTYWYCCCCCCCVSLRRPSHVSYCGRILRQREASPEKRGPYTLAEVRLRYLSIDGSINHLHLRNFNLHMKERNILSRDNTHGKLLKTDHETFVTMDFTSTYIPCDQWVFGVIRNRIH